MKSTYLGGRCAPPTMKSTHATFHDLRSVEQYEASTFYWHYPHFFERAISPRTWAARVIIASEIRRKAWWKGFLRNWLRSTPNSCKSSSVGFKKSEARSMYTNNGIREIPTEISTWLTRMGIIVTNLAHLEELPERRFMWPPSHSRPGTASAAEFKLHGP
jgi:hypothetical protein